MHRHLVKWLILFIICIFFLPACTYSSPALPKFNTQGLTGGASFGQTFTSKNKGLNGISVMLTPASSIAQGSLLFHLRTSSQATEDIARARLPISEISQQAYYRFDFPPQSDSQGKDYYLQVDVEDGGLIDISYAKADAYLDGSIYINQFPQDGQLLFQLQYDQKEYLLGMLQTVVGWFPVILFGLIAFILPGWGLFSLFWRGWDELIWPIKLGLSGGLSLAIYPVLMLWTDLVGLHLGVVYAILPPIGGLIALLWKNSNVVIHMGGRLRRIRAKKIIEKFPSREVILADIAFLLILGLVIISRFWMIRSLDVPLFGDSYQHTMISQLIIDHGGLFDSWEPYADLITFTYHFGFHSAVAVYHWISGTNVEKSILWAGQLVNVLAILALYPLAYKFTRNRWAGVFALLIGGLLSPMPNYYVNWGRYTQLAGQVILLTLIWCAWFILDKSQSATVRQSLFHKLVLWNNLSLDLGSLVIVWLALGGLALTHYRILILAILFFPAIGIFDLFRKKFTVWLGKTAWMGLGGMLLFLPWFIHVFAGKILNTYSTLLTKLPATASVSGELVAVAGNLRAYLPLGIWITFILCLFIGLAKRNIDLAILTVWWGINLLVANPSLLGLPGSGAIPNFAVLIAFYIPASIGIGSGLVWFGDQLNRLNAGANWGNTLKKYRAVVSSMFLLIICVLGLLGLNKRARELNPSAFALVTRPDLRAMDWIRTNTNPDSRFMINSMSAYDGTSIVGSDAGWWLPLLADRHNTVPPLTYAAEQAPDPGYGQELIKFYNIIRDNGITSTKVLELLNEQGINYIYLGQRQGSVNNPGSKSFDPQVLLNDSHFKSVYHEDRVWIFAIQ